jgi:hypothetical protein
MAITKYSYVKDANLGRLDREIRSSTVLTALDHISIVGSALDIYFKDELTTDEQTALAAVVAATINTPDPIVSPPTDSDGSPLMRPKATKTGWFFQVHSLEIKTSTLGGCYNKCVDINTGAELDLGFATAKYYDADHNEITTQEGMVNCVQTRMDWSTSHDQEIRGGTVSQGQRPPGDCRLWVATAPGLVNAFFLQGGMNLRNMQVGNFTVDGETAKFLPSPTSPGGSMYGMAVNKMRFILRHEAGLQHSVQFSIHLYKP